MSGTMFASRSVAKESRPNPPQTVVSAVTRTVSKGVLHSLKLDGTTSESSVELCFVTPHNEYQYHVMPVRDERNVCNSVRRKSKIKGEGLGSDVRRSLPRKSKTVGVGAEGRICPTPLPRKSKTKSEGVGVIRNRILKIKAKDGGLEGRICHPTPRKSKTKSEGVGDNLKRTLPLKKTKGVGLEGNILHPTRGKSKIKSVEMEGRVCPSRQWARSGPKAMDPVIKQKWLEAEPVIQQKWDDILRTVNSMPGAVKAKRCRNVAQVARNATDVPGMFKRVPQSTNLYDVKNPSEKFCPKSEKVGGRLLRNLEGANIERKTQYYSSDLRDFNRDRRAKSVSKNTAKTFKYKVIIPPKRIPAPLYSHGVKKKTGTFLVVNSLPHSRAHSRVRSNNSQKVRMAKPESNPNPHEQVFQLAVSPVSFSPVIEGNGRMMREEARMVGETSKKTLNAQAVIDEFSSSRSKERKMVITECNSREDKNTWVKEAAIAKSSISKSKERKTFIGQAVIAESSTSREDQKTLVTRGANKSTTSRSKERKTFVGQAIIAESSSSREDQKTMVTRGANKSTTSRSKDRKTIVTRAAIAEFSSSSSKDRKTSVARFTIAESSSSREEKKTSVRRAVIAKSPSSKSKERKTLVSRAAFAVPGEFTNKETGPVILAKEKETALLFYLESAVDLLKGNLVKKAESEKEDVPSLMSGESEQERECQKDKDRLRLTVKPAVSRDQSIRNVEEVMSTTDSVEARVERHVGKSNHRQHTKDALRKPPENMSHRTQTRPRKYELSHDESGTMIEATKLHSSQRRNADISRYEASSREMIDDASDDNRNRRRHGYEHRRSKTLPLVGDDRARRREHITRKFCRGAADRTADDDRRKQRDRREKDGRNNGDGANVERGERNKHERRMQFEEETKGRRSGNRDGIKRRGNESMKSEDERTVYEKGIREVSKKEKMYANRIERKGNSDCSVTDEWSSRDGFTEPPETTDDERKGNGKSGRLDSRREKYTAHDGTTKDSRRSRQRLDRSDEFESKKMYDKEKRDPEKRKEFRVKERVVRCDQDFNIALDDKEKSSRVNNSRALSSVKDSVLLLKERDPKTFSSAKDSVTLIKDTHARRNCNKEQSDDSGQYRPGRNVIRKEMMSGQNAVKDVSDSSGSSLNREPAVTPGEGKENGKEFLSLCDTQSIEEEIVLLKKCLDVLKANHVSSV